MLYVGKLLSFEGCRDMISADIVVVGDLSLGVTWTWTWVIKPLFEQKNKLQTHIRI